MSAVHSDFALILRAARTAVRRVTRARGAEWTEDLVQEVATMVWLNHEAGFKVARRRYLLFALSAFRVVLGDDRYNGKGRHEAVPLEEAHSVATATRDPLGPLCMKRLQELWPTFTESQKAGLFSLIVDDGYGAAGDAAEAFGVNLVGIDSARKRAIERINNPKAFQRRPKVGVREMPLGERRAYEREKQRRYLERQKRKAVAA